MIYLILFVAGTCMGSFGLVLTDRLSDFSWQKVWSCLFGRSVCDHNGNKLQRYELIPVLSFVVQGGKSRYTNKKISYRYLVYELLFGVLFVVIGWWLQSLGLGRGMTIYLLLIQRIFVLLALYDIRTGYLHIPVRYMGLFVIVVGYIPLASRMVWGIFGAILLGLIFWILYHCAAWYARRFRQQDEGLGEGDIWMSILIGSQFVWVAYLGETAITIPYMIGLSILFLLISSIVALCIALVLRRGFGSSIAFVPAMIIAYTILLVWGSDLLALLQL